VGEDWWLAGEGGEGEEGEDCEGKGGEEEESEDFLSANRDVWTDFALG